MNIERNEAPMTATKQMRKSIRTGHETAWLVSEATSRVIAATGKPSPTPSTVLAYALDALEQEMNSAAAAGKSLDFDKIMGTPIEEFCSMATLPPVSATALNGRHIFTVAGSNVIRHLMAMNARLTLELLPVEVRSAWTIRCALRLFLLQAYSTVPMVASTATTSTRAAAASGAGETMDGDAGSKQASAQFEPEPESIA